MNLSNQIRDLRKDRGLSQEELAERIYVSRQTISNWETQRSYPDVQSLLMLSVLFDVSLDELVKGDIDMMKQTIDSQKMNTWSVVMVVCCVLSVVIASPLVLEFGWVGLIIPGIIYAVGLGASLVLERIKKKNNIQTYMEIVEFMDEGKEYSEKTKRVLGSHNRMLMILLVVAFGVVAAVLAVSSGFVYTLFR